MVTEEEHRLSRSSRVVLKEEVVRRMDVPGDGSCLFWAVSLPYLIHVKNNAQLFCKRFERLFGAKELSKSQHVRHLIIRFHTSRNSSIYHDKILRTLVTQVFRYKLVEKMGELEDELFESVTINDFIDMKNESFVTDGTFRDKFRNAFTFEIEGHNVNLDRLQPEKLNNETVQVINSELDKISSNRFVDLQKFKFRMYLESMKGSNSWGGNHEIQTMSHMLGCEIVVFSENLTISGAENSIFICLFNNQQVHYQFGLIRAQFLAEFSDRNPDEGKTSVYVNLGVDDINHQNTHGSTLLHFAAKNNHPKLIHLLINQGAEADTTNHLGHTALDIANSLNLTDSITALDHHIKQDLSLASKQTQNICSMGKPADHSSIQTDDLKTDNSSFNKQVDDSLLSKQIDGSLTSKHAHNVSLECKQSDFDRETSKSGDAQDKNGGERGLKYNKIGRTILHTAAEEGNEAILQRILSRLGQDEETPLCMLDAAIDGERKQTALHLAARSNRVKVVEILLENRAKVSVKDVNSEGKDNWTPLHYAAEKGHLRVVKLLVEKGQAEVDVEDRTKGTPLQRAVRFGQLGAVKYLVQAGANVNSRDQTKISILSYAAKAGCMQTVYFLVEKNAEINTVDKNSITPVHHAANSSNWEIVKYLVERGADVNVENKEKKSPLIKVVKSGQWALAKFLIENGALTKGLTDKQFFEVFRKNSLNFEGEDALFSVISMGNVEYLEKYFSNLVKNNPDILFKVLPKVYEEIKALKLPISQNVSLFIESQLFKCRLFSDGIDRNIQKNDVENIKKRINLVIDGIKNLEKISLSELNEISDAFVFVGRFIAQNMQILKEQVRFSFDKLPWVEMQFCSVNFISGFCGEWKDSDVIYKLVMNKARLMKHLTNFRIQLENLVNDVKLDDEYPFKSRKEIMDSVVGFTSGFKDLYEDYELLRDVYSLNRIQSYVIPACLMDVEKDFLVGQQVIFRALQVTGECLKNTLDTPNMSDKVHHLLIALVPKNVKEIANFLRDSLSEVEHLRKTNNPTFLLAIQKDLMKLKDEIAFILSLKKNSAAKMVLRRISECENIEMAKEIFSGVQRLERIEIELSDKRNDVFNKVAELIEKFKSQVKNPTEVQQIHFKRLENVVEKYGLRLADIDNIEAVNSLSGLILKDGEIDLLREIAGNQINKLNLQSKNSENFFEEVLENVAVIFNSLKDPSLNINELYEEILEVIDFEADGRVKGIDTFVRQISKKIEFEEETDKVKNEQITSLKSYFFEKLDILAKIFPNKNSDAELLALLRIDKTRLAVEMLVLNLTETLYKLSLFQINRLFLDEISPVLVGQNLLNFLLHGDPLISIITTNYEISLVNHFRLFQQKFHTAGEFYHHKQLIGKTTEENIPELCNYYQQNLQTLIKKTNLFNITKHSETEEFNKVIDKSVDLKVRSANGDTLLHISAQLNNLDIFKHLLEQGLSVFVKNKRGHSVLHSAITSGSDKIVEYLLEIGFDSSFIAEKGQTLLHLAVQHGHLRIVKLLLANGADIEAVNDEGNKPVIDAVVNGHQNIVLELLNAGSDVESRDKNGKSLVHLATSNVEVLKVIIERKAKVTVLDHDRNTPLHLACSEGREEAVKMLLGNKASAINVNKHGETPLHYAALKGHAKIVQILVNKNVEIDVKTVKEATALHLACFGGHLEVVQSLLKNGADLNMRNADEMNALHMASVMGHARLVEALLSYTVEIDCPAKGVTALHMAAECGETEVFKRLVQRGASVNFPSKDGFSALHTSSVLENLELMAFILEKNNLLVNAIDDKRRTPLHMAVLANKIKSVNFLVEKNADLEAKDGERMTPLHVSAVKGHTDIFNVLLSKGSDINAEDGRGWTVLHACAQNNNKEMMETLIKRKVNVNAQCKEGCAALHVASQNGHLEMVKRLIESGADIDVTGLNAWSALHFASLNGHAEIVRFLLEKNAKNDFSDSNASTPLHLAAQHGHFPVLRLLLDNNDGYVNSLARNKATALQSAAENGDVSCVNLLIEHGARVDATFKDKWTALHLAAMKGHVQVVKALVDKVDSVDARLENGCTALHLAAQSDFNEVVEFLIKNNADVNAVYLNGKSSLHNSSAFGHKDTVLSLLKHGAHVDARDENQRTALHYAADKGHAEIVRILLDNGTQVNAKDLVSWTALHLATDEGHIDTVECLLANQAHPNSQTENGSTALHLAVNMGFLRIVEALLNRPETEVDLVDANCHTPLHFAAQMGHTEIVQLLIDRSANVDMLNKTCATPLHLSSFNGHFETVQLLLTSGATVDFPNKDELTPLHVAALYRHLNVAIELLKFGADVNSKSSVHATPLHMAVEKNDLNTVVHLLSVRNVDVNAKKLDGVTPLHLSAFFGFLEVADSLVREGANVNSKTKLNYTPLHLATQNKHCHIIRLLANNGADMDAAFDSENTGALQLAVQFGAEDVVETLLENGARVMEKAIILSLELDFTGIFKRLARHRSGSEGTALHRAVRSKNGPLLKVILGEVNKQMDWSSDLLNEVVNAVDGEGKTALMVAAESGYLLAVGLLLSCGGVSLDGRTPKGSTALHLSAENGHEKIVDMLISSGADANARDTQGRTAFDLVNQKISEDAEKYEPIAAILLSLTN